MRFSHRIGVGKLTIIGMLILGSLVTMDGVDAQKHAGNDQGQVKVEVLASTDKNGGNL